MPPELRQFVLHSSLHYAVRDLINLTKINAEPSLNSSANPIHLLTQWYSESNRRRKQELISVLHMNVINSAIANIHFIQNSISCTVYDDILLDPDFQSIYYAKN